ncbi:hypothetical protein [Nonomuraea typhae]|uniref:hypothetical protein n=1 Tax=Nonomuraea typhae TaxID=2603600 RepID=UPI0012FA3907|nr:hypothetical protein [Nonomuraea typhae]
MSVEIAWTSHFRDTEYGMVGEIKAFSLVDHRYGFTLYPRLPDRQGVRLPDESFRTSEEAKAQAEVLLGEFIAAFLAEVRLARPAALSQAMEAS